MDKKLLIATMVLLISSLVLYMNYSTVSTLETISIQHIKYDDQTGMWRLTAFVNGAGEVPHIKFKVPREKLVSNDFVSNEDIYFDASVAPWKCIYRPSGNKKQIFMIDYEKKECNNFWCLAELEELERNYSYYIGKKYPGTNKYILGTHFEEKVWSFSPYARLYVFTGTPIGYYYDSMTRNEVKSTINVTLRTSSGKIYTGSLENGDELNIGGIDVKFESGIPIKYQCPDVTKRIVVYRYDKHEYYIVDDVVQTDWENWLPSIGANWGGFYECLNEIDKSKSADDCKKISDNLANAFFTHTKPIYWYDEKGRLVDTVHSSKNGVFELETQPNFMNPIITITIPSDSIDITFKKIYGKPRIINKDELNKFKLKSGEVRGIVVKVKNEANVKGNFRIRVNCNKAPTLYDYKLQFEPGEVKDIPISLTCTSGKSYTDTCEVEVYQVGKEGDPNYEDRVEVTYTCSPTCIPGYTKGDRICNGTKDVLVYNGCYFVYDKTCGEDEKCYNGNCIKWECNSNIECDDNDPSTIDECIQHTCHHIMMKAPKITCGNGICEPKYAENSITCPEDCGNPTTKPVCKNCWEWLNSFLHDWKTCEPKYFEIGIWGWHAKLHWENVACPIIFVVLFGSTGYIILYVFKTYILRRVFS